MVDLNLKPEENGTVETYGEKNPQRPDHVRASRMQEDVERHGDVHARFDGVDDGLVEVRLGNSLFNYSAGTIEVFDGDQYHPFGMELLVDWDVPMDLYHE